MNAYRILFEEEVGNEQNLYQKIIRATSHEDAVRKAFKLETDTLQVKCIERANERHMREIYRIHKPNATKKEKPWHLKIWHYIKK